MVDCASDRIRSIVQILNEPNKILDDLRYPFEAGLERELRLMERRKPRKWWQIEIGRVGLLSGFVVFATRTGYRKMLLALLNPGGPR